MKSVNLLGLGTQLRFTLQGSIKPKMEPSFSASTQISRAPLSPAVMSDEERFEMREWASMNGAVVRQRSTRQETTIAKAGTLPEAAYRSLLQPVNCQLEDPFKDHEITENENEERNDDDDEELEFETLNRTMKKDSRL